MITPTRIFGKEFVFVGKARHYDVADPRKVGERVSLLNRLPAYLWVQARRVSDQPITRVQQSDYVTAWAAAGDTAVRGRTGRLTRTHVPGDALHPVSAARVGRDPTALTADRPGAPLARDAATLIRQPSPLQAARPISVEVTRASRSRRDRLWRRQRVGLHHLDVEPARVVEAIGNRAGVEGRDEIADCVLDRPLAVGIPGCVRSSPS